MADQVDTKRALQRSAIPPGGNKFQTALLIAFRMILIWLGSAVAAESGALRMVVEEPKPSIRILELRALPNRDQESDGSPLLIDATFR